MPVNRKLYPGKSVWAEMRKERLEIAGYLCEDCGAPDAEQRFNEKKPHPFHEGGTPYYNYLMLAHKNHYERWNREASCVVVCPSCHAKMDAELRRRNSSYNYAPCGVVMVWVHYKGTRYPAAECRRYDDLFEAVATFEEGMRFELCPEMMMAVVGKGTYRRTVEGIAVISETGACRGFGTYLQGALEKVFSGEVY